jgi:hypothetical protein
MAADEITQRHLQRLRIRGAPSTIPDAVGSVGTYEGEETWRQLVRALVVPLPRPVTAVALKEAFARLRGVAEKQGLTISEEPLFALKGDPNEDPPHKWEYEALLPIRGNAKAEDDVTVARVQGGMHIFSMTPRGLPDLTKLYVYLLGKFMPSKKQQIMRPYILHRVVEGLEGEHGFTLHDHALTIAVWVPAVLSIKPVGVPGEGEAS